MKTRKMPKAPKGVKVSVRSYRNGPDPRCNRSGGKCSGGGTCGR